MVEITKTYTKNASIGIQDAIDLRRRQGIVSENFDKRLLGQDVNPYFQFNSSLYDLIFGELVSNNVSTLSAEILAYEILALSKWYNEPYDKILPIVVNGYLTLDVSLLTRLNYTRPSNNKLGIVTNVIPKSVSKELVD